MNTVFSPSSAPSHAERPAMPADYGVPATVEGTLPWSFVEERMTAARNYWVATVRPDGRPHAVPVWGAWLDNALYIEGSPQTRRSRNLAVNPAVVVHLESGDQVVILEGEGHPISRPDPELGARLSAIFRAKYAWANYQPGPDAWDHGGLHVIRPHTVFAWSAFPADATRWRL